MAIAVVLLSVRSWWNVSFNACFLYTVCFLYRPICRLFGNLYLLILYHDILFYIANLRSIYVYICFFLVYLLVCTFLVALVVLFDSS